MERLWIVRHGKAEQGSDSGLDFDRVLKPRGQKQAAWLGRLLAERWAEALGDRRALLSSPAARAIETAELVAHELYAESGGVVDGDGLASVIRDDRLGLDTDVGEAIWVARDAQERGVDEAVLFGHNPTFSALVSVLVFGVGGGLTLRTGECAVLVPRGDGGELWVPGAWELEAVLRSDD